MMPDILTVQEAMSLVMTDVGAVAKTGINVQQHFNFRGVDAVVNAVSPALQKHKVVVVPTLKHIEYETYATSKGTNMMSARVIVTYRFIGPGGDSIEATVAGEASDAGDKATAKAMSVAFRTALLQALALPTDEPDPDEQSYDRSGESTAAAKGSVTHPTEPSGAQAAQDVASPAPSAAKGVAADGVEAPAGDADANAPGEGAGATTTPAGASTTYLSKDDQFLLAEQYGTKGKAVMAYRARFGERINRIEDITYMMRDEMETTDAKAAQA